MLISEWDLPSLLRAMAMVVRKTSHSFLVTALSHRPNSKRNWRVCGDIKGGAMEEFKRQRRTGMIMIGLAMPVAVALWLAIDQLMPPILSMENFASREAFALKCWCVAVLFTLVMGVEAVAHERLGSPAFDPLARFETRRLKVNERYLQNTLEQTVVFAAALF